MKALRCGYKLLAVLLLLECAIAQIPKNQRSLDRVNGRFWLSMTPEDRSLFLFGYSEAVGFFQVYKEHPKGCPEGVPLGEVRAAIDQFYASVENRILPIGEAIWFWTRKANGEESAQVDKELAREIHFYRSIGTSQSAK